MAERFTVEARQDRGTAPIRPSIVDLAPDAAGWDAFVARSNPGSYLQTTAWADVKAPNGWRPLRFVGTRPVERTRGSARGLAGGWGRRRRRRPA